MNRGHALVVSQVPDHDNIAKVRERLDRLEQARGIEPPGLSL
jgi:hypothetical protein